MKLIGITGPTGAGKSIICDRLQELGIPCIDADRVYHNMLLPPSECLDAIRASFGSDIFSPDGKLDRAELAAIVFADPKKLELLNRTVLGHVLCEIRLRISEYRRRGFDTVVVDAPTLIESGFNKECTAVIAVLAPEEHRLVRIKERDSLTEEKALSRIRAQKSDDFYKENADVVIFNDGDLSALVHKTDDILEKLNVDVKR